MKRLFLVLVLFFFILASVSSQERKHTVFADIFPMFNGIFSGGVGLGIGYDYRINEYFSIGSYINFFSNFNENMTYNIILNGRFYPINTEIGAPYIDLGLGYRRRRSEEDNIHCLSGVANIGYRFIFNNGLVLDPAFGIRYNLLPFSGYENFNFGYNIKAVIGYTLSK